MGRRRYCSVSKGCISVKNQITKGVIATFVLALIGLLFTRIYVSEYGKEDYVLISTILAVMSAIFNLDALQKPLVFEYHNCKNKSIDFSSFVKMATSFSLVIGLIGGGIFGISVHFMGFNVEDREFVYLILGSLGFIVFFFWSTPHNAYLVFMGKSHANQIWKLINYGLFFIGVLIVSNFWGSGEHVFLLLIASGFLGFIYITRTSGLSLSLSVRIKEAFSRFHKIFFLGLYLNISIFMFMMIDKFFLNGFSLLERSDYLIPYELILKISIIHGIVGSALLGDLSLSLARNNSSAFHLYIKRSILYIVLTGFSCLFLFLTDDFFFDIWLAGQSTDSMLLVYDILILSFFLNSFGVVGFNILLMMKQLNVAGNIYLFLPITLLVSCFLFVEKIGVVGIAVSVVVARIFDVVLCFFAFRCVKQNYTRI